MAPPVLPDSVPICSLTGPKTSVSCLDCGFQTNLSRRPLHIWTWLCRLDCFAWSSSSTLRPFEPLLYTVARVIVIKCQLCPFTAPSGSPTAATVPLVLLGEPSGGRPAAPECLGSRSRPFCPRPPLIPVLCLRPSHVPHLCLEHLSCPSAPSAGSLLPSRQLSLLPLRSLPWPFHARSGPPAGLALCRPCAKLLLGVS